jgi:excisionase family DNA binding protein
VRHLQEEAMRPGGERLLTITEAASALGVHQNTLRSWANKGLVPVTLLPSRHRRFSSQQVEDIRQRMLNGWHDVEGEPAPTV